MQWLPLSGKFVHKANETELHKNLIYYYYYCDLLSMYWYLYNCTV